MTTRIAFCAAASPAVGGGHVVRSISIANALAASGATCTFFTHRDALMAAPLLNHSGHVLVVLPGDAGANSARANTCDVFDWTVIDDYNIAASQEAAWRPVTRKILVLDDLANRAHDCDLLLDSTPSRKMADYLSLVPRHARLLLGPRYAPVRMEFTQKRFAALARREQPRTSNRLFVSFGLVDPGGITAEAVVAIATALPDLAMDVVLGRHAQSRRQIEALGRANIHLHTDPASMSDLIAQADIGLGGGGSTAWERACLGLPSIAILLAENQRALSLDFQKSGALYAIEKNQECWDKTITALRNLCESHATWRTMSIKAASMCDGLGAQRVVAELDPPHTKSGQPVRLRPATHDDIEQVFRWQAAPGARTYSSNPQPPTWSEHQDWMAKKLSDLGCIFSIIEEAEVPAGVLRMDRRRDGSFIISVLVSDAARGRGVGLAALRAAAKIMQGQTLWAKIDERNAFSLRMFNNAGFARHKEALFRSDCLP